MARNCDSIAGNHRYKRCSSSSDVPGFAERARSLMLRWGLHSHEPRAGLCLALASLEPFLANPYHAHRTVVHPSALPLGIGGRHITATEPSASRRQDQEHVPLQPSTRQLDQARVAVRCAHRLWGRGQRRHAGRCLRVGMESSSRVAYLGLRLVSDQPSIQPGGLALERQHLRPRMEHSNRILLLADPRLGRLDVWSHGGSGMMRWLAACAVITLVALLLLASQSFGANEAAGESVAHARPAPALRAWGNLPQVRRHHRHKMPKNWRFFVAIGRCEQPAPSTRMRHGKWPARYAWGIDWHQRRNYSYPGGLGVWAPLWTEKGIAGTDMARSADRATPVQQMIHAQRIVDRYGAYAWGCTGVALSQSTLRS